MFFFEKKNQKTFGCCRGPMPEARQKAKVFVPSASPPSASPPSASPKSAAGYTDRTFMAEKIGRAQKFLATLPC
jgi:hypothetical protein